VEQPPDPGAPAKSPDGAINGFINNRLIGMILLKIIGKVNFSGTVVVNT
jgi:hypothetical protein